MEEYKRLTKTVVQALKYRGREYVGSDGKPKFEPHIVWDSTVSETKPKFGVRVSPTGKRTFVVRYRVGRRRRLYTLGEFDVDGLTVQKARGEAEDLLAEIRTEKRDPVEERQKVDAKTLGELWKAYDLLYLPDLRPGTRKGYRAAWKYLKPLARRRLTEITAADVKKLQRKVRDERGTYAADDMLKLFRRLYAVAAELELLPPGTDPSKGKVKGKGIQFYGDRERDEYLNADELKALAEALDSEEADHNPDGADFIRLLVLTGCRPQELREAEWSDVDLEAGLLIIPKERSKVGKRETRELPPGAVVILKRVREREHKGRDRWVFPRRDGKGPRTEGFRKSWDRVREAAGLEVPQYVLRHTHASWSIAQGLSLKMTGDMLGHTQAQTTARYTHLVRDAREEASRRVSEAIEAAMEGREADVVPIRKGGAA